MTSSPAAAVQDVGAVAAVEIIVAAIAVEKVVALTTVERFDCSTAIRRVVAIPEHNRPCHDAATAVVQIIPEAEIQFSFDTPGIDDGILPGPAQERHAGADRAGVGPGTTHQMRAVVDQNPELSRRRSDPNSRPSGAQHRKSRYRSAEDIAVIGDLHTGRGRGPGCLGWSGWSVPKCPEIPVKAMATLDPLIVPVLTI